MKIKNRSINKILIANRGEIALRIGRACKKLGITTVQPLSEADQQSWFANFSDYSEVIGPAAAKDSYLNIPKLINLAQKTNCDAIHPGYGFLSENADFAEAVRASGLIFIGPSVSAIKLLGDKTAARKLLEQHAVPITKGSKAGLSDQELIAAANEIGMPVIIKAVAGGGGRGMRVVNNAAEMKELLPRVRSEAEKFFANSDVYIEQYISTPRHVEVQIFGDSYGNVLHFGTRECSLQRRHQKIIEEAPAAFLKLNTLQEIQNAAVAAGRAVHYENAGTCEFLVKEDCFYFLEINTRIQVEHPVTEQITGLDLVEQQIRIAAGEPLNIKQEQVQLRGHAIEFRIYAEDPNNNFAPASGNIEKISIPQFPWLREDRGFDCSDRISLHYDALLSKLIVYGDDRKQALARARELFADYDITGIKNSADFHRWVLMQSDFILDQHDINYLDRQFRSELLNIVAASREKDPEHNTGTVEQFELTGQTVLITHRPDGFFLLEGNFGRRLSNSRQALIELASRFVQERGG